MSSVPEISTIPLHKTIPVSASAVAVGLAGTLLGIILLGVDTQLAAIALLWAATAGLSGTVMAFLERGMRGTWRCLGMSLLLFTGILLLVYFRFGFRLMTLMYTTPFFIIAVVTPFMARRLKHTEVKVSKYLFGIWLGQVVAVLSCSAVASLMHPHSIPLRIGLGFAASLPFGPWATEIAQLFSFPNAGEFFSLTLALVFSSLLALLLFLAVSRRSWAAHVFIPFGWLLIGWTAIGFGQLMNCLE